MRKSSTQPANKTHHGIAVVRSNCEEDYQISGQQFLGHESSKAKEIYTHLCIRNLEHVKNPLDQFDRNTPELKTTKPLHIRAMLWDVMGKEE
jgi:hypothetical protein